jgi:hypothetical protein
MALCLPGYPDQDGPVDEMDQSALPDALGGDGGR